MEQKTIDLIHSSLSEARQRFESELERKKKTILDAVESIWDFASADADWEKIAMAVKNALNENPGEYYDGKIYFAIVDCMNSEINYFKSEEMIRKLEETNSEFAAEIKKIRFGFDDFVMLNDRAMQQILREVTEQDLAIALVAANEEVQEKVFRNMANSIAAELRKKIDSLKSTSREGIYECRGKILDIVRRLEEDGTILIERDGEELV